ncbi:hypothetical protein DAETH_48620 (plasmid) [Deinococcus aetherius]|uniref:Uncharacterized protein n=1 Tax=Deinococcus aetherius TaxID=200252 RepID=A0ABN6RNN8_9DEIO|nr:hypothetical protein [Deinococcus aetherius]BDP44893.1 hypothetical protein DAETH_48620 [Deinococcus aetherius]
MTRFRVRAGRVLRGPGGQPSLMVLVEQPALSDTLAQMTCNALAAQHASREGLLLVGAQDLASGQLCEMRVYRGEALVWHNGEVVG